MIFNLNNSVLQTLLSSKNPPFAAITALQTFGILGNLKRFHLMLPKAPPTNWIGLMGTSYVSHGQAAPTTAQ